MDDFHRCAEVGVGGWECPCCGPAPKHRAKARRQARHRLKQKLDKEIRDEVAHGGMPTTTVLQEAV